MTKVWVLDTETKGTGAQMVPLEKVQQEARARPRAVLRTAQAQAARAEARRAAGAAPFRVVDVATRAVLADGALARETLSVLGDVRSSVDVHVYVWEPDDDRWRLLTLAEQRMLWERRVRTGS